MTIKQSELNEKYLIKYYEELLTITKFYKKISKKPTLKTIELSKLRIKVFSFYQLLLTMLIIYTFLIRYYFLLELQISLFVLLVLSLCISIRKIKNIVKKEIKSCKEIKDTSIIFNENEIIKHIKYNDENKTSSISFSNVKYIIINNYTIIFMPKKTNPLEESIICIPAIDKKKIMPYFKKIDKENIIIDNSKLYNKKNINLKSKINMFKLDIEIWFYRVK
ncbi:MAG: hypothetical protein IKF19_05245 [Bacilli bacterium]|nr:hypothetical protein [Bacilli bacterium]